MSERIIRFDLKNIFSDRFYQRLSRLEKGLPGRAPDTRERDPEKRKNLVEFWLSTTPPAEDILSGKWLREFMKKR